MPTHWTAAMDLADAQGGAVSHRQLRDLGISSSAIGRRLDNDWLTERHGGVYMLGRRSLSRRGEAWAAGLVVGDRGALTGWSALALLGAAPWPRRPQIVVLGGGIDIGGADVRRTRRLGDHEVWTDRSGLRACTWPRAIVDLAADASVAELQDAVDGVERRRILDIDRMEQAIGDARGRPGMRKLRRALEPYLLLSEGEYRSLLERFTGVVLRRAGLGTHEPNHPIRLLDGRRIHVDVYFPDARVAVEVDGRSTHERARQFAADRWRDRELHKLGIVPLRFTWQDVRFRPALVVADISLFVCRDGPGIRVRQNTRVA